MKPVIESLEVQIAVMNRQGVQRASAPASSSSDAATSKLLGALQKQIDGLKRDKDSKHANAVKQAFGGGPPSSRPCTLCPAFLGGYRSEEIQF